MRTFRKEKKIEDPRIKEYCTQLKAAYHRNDETVSDEMIEQMKELREIYITHERPTIVKSIRLTYEHIQRYGDFSVRYWDEDEDQPDVSGFEYYIDLIANPNNKYNRDEIKELNLRLKASLTDEDE